MRILSIDPGETSAFVIGYMEPNKAGIQSFHTNVWGAWSGLEELALLVENKLFERVDVLVIEDYRVYSRSANMHIGSQVRTVREIGRIEWFAFKAATPMHYQMASQAKGRWPNSRMKMYPVVKLFLDQPELKKYKKIRRHILDAYRHLLTYLETIEEVEFNDVVEGTY